MRTRLDNEEFQKAIENIIIKFNNRLKEKGDHGLCSTHECLGLLEEEIIELQDAIHDNDMKEFENELIDVGVCVILSLASLYGKTLDW